MKNWIRSVSVFALMIGLIWTTAASAQMGPMGEGGMGHHKGSRMGKMRAPHGMPFNLDAMRESLKLTDEQSDKMHQLWLNYEKEIIRRRADVKIANLELLELLGAKTPNIGQVEKKIRQLEGLQGDLTLARVKHMLSAKDFLSDEQFEIFKERSLSFSFRGMGMGMKGKMKHGRMPGMMRERMMERMHPMGMMPMDEAYEDEE